ncbi:MAG: pantetheine-phosphate adenylyltransferase [Bdellovibrionales bacterium]
MKFAVYPGSFDPLTKGHIDIIERAQGFFDKLYILVAKSFDKKPIFTVEERVALIRESVAQMDFTFKDKIEVIEWSGLTVDFAKEHDVSCIVRGVRSSVDFQMEQTLANVNHELFPGCETLLLCCRPQFRDLSSRLVKEIAQHKGSISKFVPEHVEKALALRIEELRSDRK